MWNSDGDGYMELNSCRIKNFYFGFLSEIFLLSSINNTDKNPPIVGGGGVCEIKGLDRDVYDGMCVCEFEVFRWLTDPTCLWGDLRWMEARGYTPRGYF